jgi:hypothetical protein
VNSTKLKVLFATAGAGAVLAMGAVTLALGAVHAPSDSIVSDTPSATLGETVTTTTAPSAPLTPVATPPVTATTPEGFATP